MHRFGLKYLSPFFFVRAFVGIGKADVQKFSLVFGVN